MQSYYDYRKKAEEIRAIVADAELPGIKKQLLQIALQYEALAVLTERRWGDAGPRIDEGQDTAERVRSDADTELALRVIRCFGAQAAEEVDGRVAAYLAEPEPEGR